MPDGREELQVETCQRLTDIPAAEWDACAGGDNPFLTHRFLTALEESASVCREEGWLPQHLLLRDSQGLLLGAMPLYLKGHSQGEYIFDYGWANAYERAGGRYYPKLLSAVPFTPVTGPRLLVRESLDPVALQSALLSGLVQLTDRLQVSSAHVNFPPASEVSIYEDRGFLIRNGHQYHWENRGYRDFDDFLDTLTSRKRKSIRKERRKVAESGIRIERLTGDALTPEHWAVFYVFYQDTYDRKWGHPYLTPEFFEIVQETMRDDILLVMAYDGETPVAGALNLIGSDALFGRNWGSDGEYKFLHFEACYYQAIDFAIERGLQRVEAGTQGEHKVQRGYRPVRTFSAHYIPNESFRDAVAEFLDHERREVTRIIDHLDDYTPFRQENEG
ncbi:MAG: GNAT family N-acetyltransferase [Alphaproteobacteria bacterium]